MKNLLFLLLFLGAFLPTSQAARYFVNAATGNDTHTGTSWGQAFQTLQKAIEVANNNDEIWLTGGTYVPTKDFSGQTYPTTLKIFLGFYINKSLQIYGHFAGTEATAAQRNAANAPTILSADIDGDDLSSPAQSLSDIQGTNGSRLLYMTNLPANGIVRLDDLVITGAAGEGGLILVGGGSNITVTGCSFSGNFASGSNAQGAAGATFIGSSGALCFPKISGCSFDHNENQNGPGGCFIWAATGPCNANITNCSFSDNTARYGGGLSIFAANSEACLVTVSGSTFANNSAIFGGGGAGLSCSNATLQCSGSNFSNNQAYLGGAVSNSEVLGNNEVVFDGCGFYQNQATSGGAMFLQSANTRVLNSIFDGNTASTDGGGGIFISDYFVPLTSYFYADHTSFANNTSGQNGGGICNRDPLATIGITRTIFQGNTAQNGGAFSQEYEANSSVNTSIDRGIFSGNSATANGGAIYLRQADGTSHAGGLQVSYSTFYQNEASTAGATVFADNTTFNGNNLISSGSSTAASSGEFRAVNNGLLDVSHSLLESADCASGGLFNCAGNIYNLDPLFVNAGNQNFHLQMCSPAVNTGGFTGSNFTDYDNNPRPYNDGTGALDMGAFEFQGTPPNSFYTDNDGDGYGILTSKIRACSAPPGFAALTGDCYDNNAAINPGAAEICDGVDNNCNNLVDSADPTHVDTDPPTFVTATPVNVQLTCTDAIPTAATLTATDNCTPNPAVTMTQTTTRSTNPQDCAYYTYQITRTWKATDLKGNTTTVSQTISVSDLTPPTLQNIPANITVECTPPAPATVAATDNCSPTVSITQADVRTNGACPQTYTITRTWTATDKCGNTATASQLISVRDITPPVLQNIPANITVECAPPAPAVVTATDNCSSVVTITQTDVQSNQSCPQTYTITRIWTATDQCGNTATASQLISVRDVTPPVLYNIPANTTVECAPPASSSVTATDNCSAAVTITQTDVRSNESCPQTYTLTRTWTATDQCGNTATASQTILVRDVTPPVLHNVPGNITLECAPPSASLVTATDNCSAQVTVTQSEVRTNGACPQTYTLTRTWIATDECGNTATATQVIEVQDIKPPFVLAVPAAQIMLECDQAIPQITSLPNQDCDANPILTVTEITEELHATGYDHVFRRIKRHIVLADHCGNATEFDQVISIRDIISPEIVNCPADITVNGDENGAQVDFPAAVVNENCSYDLYYTPYEPGSHFPVGTTQMFIDVFDHGANSASCSFQVTVLDDLKVHCQDLISATILPGTFPATNTILWNPPFAVPCTFCDDQQNDPQFQQQFRLLGDLNGHRYYISKSKLPAAQAASVCTQYGGYLATPGSATENRMLTNELAGQTALIGLSDVATEGVFKWADGQPFGFQHWATGQPNIGVLTAPSLDYVKIAADGRWENVGADSTYFLLEVACYDLRTTTTSFPANNQASLGFYTVNYQIQDHCGYTDECQQNIQVLRRRVNYCQPNLYPDVLDRDTSLWIQKVQIGTFSQVTGNNHGSARYLSNINALLPVGQTVPITVTLGTTADTAKAYIHIWLDANADRDFYDVGEMLLDTFITTNQLSFNAFIPTNTVIGDLKQRLRVAVSRYYAPEACGDYPVGETEDYRVATTAPSGNNSVEDRNTLTPNALLFPNPATTEAFLNLSEYENATCTIRILDIQGRTVQSFAVENVDDALIVLDLTGLLPGIYMVQTQAEGHDMRTDKLIIASDK